MILHIGAYSSKHILFPFIEFINGNFNQKEHYHILCSKENIDLDYPNAKTLDIFSQEQELLKHMNQADKIFLHGIWYDQLCNIVFENQSFLNKIFWIPWSADYYFPKKSSNIKKWLLKNIKYLIAGPKEDYLFIKKHYENQGHWISSSFYPNNLYYEPTIEKNKEDKKKILIGNSADPTNNHLEIFEKIEKLKLQDIKLYIPLVYGDSEYANNIEKKAYDLFGEKTNIIKEYMDFNQYLSFLSTIDIAIFNHKVQQATGNTIALLGFGSKVYINKDSNLNNYFNQFHIKLYDNENITLDLIDTNVKKTNQKNMKKYFSKDVLISTLEGVFNKGIDDG